jgi:large subunit ribosomal protein L6
MSRIGKKIITIPNGVNVTFDEKSNIVTVKGQKGTLTQYVHPDIKMTIENNELSFTRPSDERQHRAMHGLYRALVNNAVQGVSQGFKIDLEIVGVGYKANVLPNNVLEMSLGYSHGILFLVPKEIKVTAVTEKGKNPIVTLEGIDKQLIGQIAAKIRSLREVEPYKGKGIYEVNEVIRRKAGKTASKK